MARLDLATRAERIAKAIGGRDLAELPKSVRAQLERFTRAIGIDVEKFIGYAPSTRQRYIRAAKKGRTAAQERERVKLQRQERQRKRKDVGIPVDPRLIEIESLREWLDERIETAQGPRTITDDIDADILLSRDSVNEHIQVYGIQYVLSQLRGMKAGYQDTGLGSERWRGFKASEHMPDHPDERWFWYHGKLRLVTGPIDWSKIR